MKNQETWIWSIVLGGGTVGTFLFYKTLFGTMDLTFNRAERLPGTMTVFTVVGVAYLYRFTKHLRTKRRRR